MSAASDTPGRKGTPLAMAARRDILGTVASLAGHEYEIKAALDMLLSGF